MEELIKIREHARLVLQLDDNYVIRQQMFSIIKLANDLIARFPVKVG